MTPDQRILIFSRLGQVLRDLPADDFRQLADQAAIKNPWFTDHNVKRSLEALSYMLDQDKLRRWLAPYSLDPQSPRTIGLVLAGNIPMVGFHDLMSVLMSGHRALVKMSSQDDVLMPYVIESLIRIDPGLSSYLDVTDQLSGMDAVIATGSDNTSRYFEYYFGRYPHIIRQNRTSVAILTGSETDTEIAGLADDVFSYFGLGCRNASKLLLPEGYDLPSLLDRWQGYEHLGHHHKYHNNYDYHKAILLVNKEPHLDTGFALFKQTDELVSPLSVIYYDYYSTTQQVDDYLAAHAGKIQCVISNQPVPGHIPPGRAQYPEPWDYADGVDTLAFLSGLEGRKSK